MTMASATEDSHALPSAPLRQEAVALQRPPLLESDEILRGHKAVEISHNGVIYRLQATRLGKLILTK